MPMIPKKVHYCWFGSSEMPQLSIKCIYSWIKHLPDYELVRWNEDNFDVNSNQYVKEAYEAKKYAFVADYVRLYTLYHHGGIYMDTDVEVLKPLGEFLTHRAFIGCENGNFLNTGTIGSEKGHIWIEQALDDYKNKRFILPNSNLNTKTITQSITEITMDKFGWLPKNEYQVLSEGLNIYPFEFFCAKDWNTGKIHVTNETYTIHHFSGSWLNKWDKLKLRIKNVLN